MLEKGITNAILRFLRSLPECFCWKQHGGPYGCAGLPDVICCLNGRFVAFEVKRPVGDGRPAGDGRPTGGRLTKLQEVAIGKIRDAGGTAAVVTSLDDVKEILRKMNLLEDKTLETK